MRDNAIRAMDTFNHHDLCSDMLGGHDQGRNSIELTGVLVWGNPWEVSGWEVTEGFVNKLGFLLKDLKTRRCVQKSQSSFLNQGLHASKISESAGSATTILS
jgi:hypothetical protein